MMRPGMDAGAVPRRRVDLGRRLPRRPVGAVVPVARGDGRREQDRLLQPRDGRAQEGARIGADRPLGRRRIADGPLARLEVHVDPALARGRDRVAAGRDLAEARADDQQRVGGPDPLADHGRAAVAGHAQVQGVVVGDHVAAPPGGDHGHVEQLREPDEVVRAAGAQHAGAGEDHGPLGRGEQVEHRRGRPRPRAARGARGRPGRATPSGSGRWRTSSGRARSAGPGRPSTRGPDRLLERRRGGRGVVDLARPLGQRGRRCRRGRPPGTPRGRGRCGRPGRRGRTSASSRRSRCGSRSRGSRRRRRASRGMPRAGP